MKVVSTTNKRIVTYVNSKMHAWINKKADKKLLNESAFVRMLIKEAMDNDTAS